MDSRTGGGSVPPGSLGAGGLKTKLPPFALGFPYGLVLLAAAPLVYWLHARRLTRRVLVVPSLTPWLALTAAVPRRRRRVPPSALLVLHLSVTGLLAVAAAAPRAVGSGLVSGQGDRVLVLDSSTSMAAADRWQAAQSTVRSLAGQGSGLLWLISAGPLPRVVARDVDLAGLVAAAKAIRPAGAGVSWAEALEMARAVAPGAAIHVVTDGSDPWPAAVAPAATWWVVGRPEANVAVVEARARPLATGAALYARVADFAASSADVPLQLLVDGVQRDRRVVHLEPGASFETVWTVPQGGTWAEVRVDSDDALADDNRAVVPLVANGIVAQVIDVSEAVGRALAAMDGVQQVTAGRVTYRMDGSVDVTVAEGLALEATPPGGVVLFDPPGSPPGEPATDARITAVIDHPIGRGLDLAGAQVSGAPGLSVPIWAEPILEADGRVVAYAGTSAGSRVVVFGFDPSASGVAERLAFPVLVARAVTWAARGPQPGVLTQGCGVDLGNLPARVLAPDGSERQVDGGVLELFSSGRFEIHMGAAGQGPVRRLGVRAGQARESDLAVVASGGQAPAPAIGRLAHLAGAALLAWLALGLLLLEGAWRGGGRAHSGGRT